MAKPRPARVTKRSFVRLGSRANAGAGSTAIKLEVEEAAVDAMDTNGDALDFEEDGSKQTSGTGLTMGNEVGNEVVEAVGLDVQEYSESSSQRSDKGKGRAVEMEEEKHFAFMELPTELRLEIYRACLTRPCKILLSKATEASPDPAEEVYLELEEAELEEPDRNYAAINRWRASPAAHYPRHPASGPVARNARAGSHSRAINRLTRPTIPRKRQSSMIRLYPDNVALPAVAPSDIINTGHTVPSSPRVARMQPSRQNLRQRKNAESSTSSRLRNDDPLIVNILRTNKAVYKEARAILYHENIFDLSIDTAVPSLAALHQRSRRLIRHVELEIPSYTEIQDKFSEVVRLSLRYCSGLRKLVIHTPFCLPGGDGNATPNSNIQIWAQGFDILRWLPQQCDVVLMGNKNAEIEEVVNKHLHLAKTLTPVAYAHRQLIPSDADRAS